MISEIATTPVYIVEAGDVERDRDAVLNTWRGHFGPDADHPQKFHHLYQLCPFGKPVLCMLRHTATAQIVGVVAAIPRQMLCGGQEIRAAVISHCVVKSEHRSLGPALMLLSALIEACRGQFDVIYGIPNEKASLMMKRAGYRSFTQMVGYVRVVRYGPYLQRVMPRALSYIFAPLVDTALRCRHVFRRRLRRDLRAKWSTQIDPRINALWGMSLHDDGLLSVRSSTQLSWRFHTATGCAPRYLLVTSGDHLCAWFACEPSTSSTDRIQVLDYAFDAEPFATRRRYIQVLIDQVATEGFSAIELPLAGKRHIEDGWRAEAFTERSRSTVFGVWLSRTRAADAADIHLTYIDQDS